MIYLMLSIGCHKKNNNIVQKESSPDIYTEHFDYGAINVGKSGEIQIPLVNNTKETLRVKKINVCCGNSTPIIDNEIIPPNGQATITQYISKKKSGPFDITIKLLLDARTPQIRIFKISGHAVQPLTVYIGWRWDCLIEADPLSSTQLPATTYDENKILLLLSYDAEIHPYIRDDFGLNSLYFKMANSLPQIEVETSTLNAYNIPTIETNRACQAFILDIQRPLPIGEVEDIVSIEMIDGSKCWIPLSFRVVGDIYSNKSSISLGEIKNIVSKKVDLFGTKVNESDIKWSIEGELLEAIDVFPIDPLNDTDNKQYEVVVDGNKIPDHFNGYISSFITFYCGDKEHEKTRILFYGYK